MSDLTGLSYFTNLETLELRYHRITEIDELAGLQHLEFLRLTAASAAPEKMDGDTDFSALEELPKLKTLYLTFHDVSDVTGLAAALKEQGKIEYLHLQSNGIVDIGPLGDLTSLRNLVLGDNQIEDLEPLKSLSNLTSLSLSKNAITDAEDLYSLSPGTFSHIYLDDQKVEMPDAYVGETTSNPVFNIDSTIVEVTSDDDLDLSNDLTSWSFATPGEKTIKWSIPNEYHPNGQDTYGDFSGTITQTVKEHIATLDTPDITEPVCIDGAPTGPVLQYIDTEGVTYDWDREQSADGSWTGTVTAEAHDGYVLEAPSGASNWTVDEDAGVATWVEKFDEATCAPEPVVVVPEVPEVDECVDGEPVVVHLPEGPEGVEYESEITDNGDGSYTVEVRAKADNDEGFFFDEGDLPEGWEHLGDGILLWSTTVTPECDTDEPEVVAPDAPEFVAPECVDGDVVPPEVQDFDGLVTEGVSYDWDREQNADGSWTVTVTAEADDGYVLEAPSGDTNWTVDEDSGVATWVEEFEAVTCGEPEPEPVVPEVPEVDECVDGEPLVVHLPNGPQGVNYFPEVTENDDGSYTVEVRATSLTDDGVYFDLDDLPEGWEHLGDGILLWSTTVTPECDTEEPEPEPEDPPVTEDPSDSDDPSGTDEPKEPSTPQLPETGASVAGLGGPALAAIGLGGLLLLLGAASRRRFQ